MSTQNALFTSTQRTKEEQEDSRQVAAYAFLRLLASATVGVTLTVTEMFGVIVSHWLDTLVLLALNTASIYVLIWLIGKTAITALAFIQEWYMVLRVRQD